MPASPYAPAPTMRVLCYSRVSTLHQETDGESLANQARAFERWLERTGNECVASYREAASAGTIEGRMQFTRMLADLPRLKVDAVVIDTLDRFTRSLRDGLNLIEELRGHRVGLLPLDWRRDKPIDLDDDRDWRDVVDEFTSAEGERRRIRRRIKRSYDGRRERGATLVNRPPFGILRKGDYIVPDPENAWIINEIDQRAIGGEGFGTIAEWARTANPKGIISRSGIHWTLLNRNYLIAGVRTEEAQAAIDRVLDLHRERFGQRRKHDHELAGVIACGYCLDTGASPTASLMFGYTTTKAKGVQTVSVACKRHQDGQYRHSPFSVYEHRILGAWNAYVERLTQALDNPAAVEAWASTEDPQDGGRHSGLERSLAQIDQRMASLKARRDRAFDLLIDADDSIQRQGRVKLKEIDAEELVLRANRETIRRELATSAPRRRDAAFMAEALRAYRDVARDATAHERNRLNRLLCQAIGSHPRLRREGELGTPKGRNSEPILTWPELESL